MASLYATLMIMITNSPLVLLLFSSSLFLPAAAAEGNALAGYPAVFNFGDSNSDTGGLSAGLASPMTPPYGQTYFHKPSGRFSDGRLIIDFLMESMKLPLVRPYLDSVGAPSFKKGANFATGGANVQAAYAGSRNPFPLGIQVAQFVRFKARVVELLHSAGSWKVRKYLPEEKYFEKGIYMIDIGQNDLYVAFFTKSEAQVLASIPNILAEFQTGIEKLYSVGARNFWIHNTGPLGCLSRAITESNAGGNKTQSDDKDQFGCLASRNRVATAFNSQLSELCTKLRRQLPDAKLTYVDVYSAKLDLIANYSHYGFKEPLAACCGYGGPPLNYDGRVTCGATVSINGTMVTAYPCNDTSEYVNWDGIHYTEAANRFVAKQLLSGNFISGVAQGSDLFSSAN